jgi:hypothetical protein
MKDDGVHRMINNAKARATLLHFESLSITESTGLYQSHLDTARLDLSEPMTKDSVFSRNRARSNHKDSRNKPSNFSGRLL